MGYRGITRPRCIGLSQDWNAKQVRQPSSSMNFSKTCNMPVKAYKKLLHDPP